MNKLQDKKVLITAGPTREYLDPVRFLSNASSGTMGYALAEEARRLGATVTLISGPVAIKPPKGVKLISVTSAIQMKKQVDRLYPKTDYVVSAAAVSDYRPSKLSKTKIKKSSSDRILQLTPNPDILSNLGRHKKHQKLIGFCLETDNLIENARIKLKNKNLDLNFANSIDSMENAASEAYAVGKTVTRLPKSSKKILAKKMWQIIRGL